jgi:hypothetical protein
MIDELEAISYATPQGAAPGYLPSGTSRSTDTNVAVSTPFREDAFLQATQDNVSGDWCEKQLV